MKLRRKLYFVTFYAFIGVVATAQTNTFPASGNVGIGTTSPGEKFQLYGDMGAPGIGSSNSGLAWFSESSGNNGINLGFYYVNGTTPYGWLQSEFIGDSATYYPFSLNPLGGNVGIGTTSPNNLLELSGGALDFYNPGNWVAVGMDYDPTTDALRFRSNNSSTNLNQTNLSIQRVSGNVGIGTPSPGAALEVNGNVKLTSGSGASITFSDGTVQSSAYTGVTCGGDFAESVDVSGDRNKYEPGDLLVIDPDKPGNFLKSAEPYATSVTGIYSTKPGTVGRRQTTPKSLDEVPMAMVGIVPTKVSAENGPIHPGDLLVSSSTLGYAMKGTDRSRMLGAVIGKALGSLDAGKGVVEAVVTLQ